MNRATLAVVMLALTGTLVFSTVASPTALTATDAISGSVELRPSDTANGNYAHLDTNDELVVDLSAANLNVDGDGVNANGVTEITSVFEITYTGEQYAHVWLTHESDVVTFSARGHPIQSESTNVTLGPNESVAVGLVVDTTGDEGDVFVDEIEIHARVADPPEAGGSSVRSADAGGENLRVRTTDVDERTTAVTVENAPDGEPVPVGFDRLRVNEENVTLDSVTVTRASDGDVRFETRGSADPFPGATLSVNGTDALGYLRVDHATSNDELAGVTFEFSVSTAFLEDRDVDPANLTVYRRPDGATGWSPVETGVLGERDGRVRLGVESPGFSVFAVAARVPAFTVTDTGLSTSEASVGGPVTVTATVRNDGIAGTRTVGLTVDGESVEQRRVSLAAGETRTVTFEVPTDTPGGYAVAVNGTPAGTLRVVEATATAEASGTDQGSAWTDTPEERTSTDSDDRTRTSGTATEPLPGEPAAFDLSKALGLLALLVIVGSTLLLVRRVPRP